MRNLEKNMDEYDYNNEIKGWTPGKFIMSRQYDKMPKEWIDARVNEELCLVRPYEKGNAICKAIDPYMAKWISERLNKCSILEGMIDYLDHKVKEMKGYPSVHLNQASNEALKDVLKIINKLKYHEKHAGK